MEAIKRNDALIKRYFSQHGKPSKILPFDTYADFYNNPQAVERFISILNLCNRSEALQDLLDAHLDEKINFSLLPAQILRIQTHGSIPSSYCSNPKLSALIGRGGRIFRVLREEAVEIDHNRACAMWLSNNQSNIPHSCQMYGTKCDPRCTALRYDQWRRPEVLLQYQHHTVEEVRKSVAKMDRWLLISTAFRRWLPWSNDEIPKTGETWCPLDHRLVIAAFDAAGQRDDIYSYNLLDIWKHLLLAHGPFRFNYTRPDNFKALVKGISEKTKDKLKEITQERPWSLDLLLCKDAEPGLEILRKFQDVINNKELSLWTKLSSPAQDLLKQNFTTFGRLLANLVSDNQLGFTPVKLLGLDKETEFWGAYSNELQWNCKRFWDSCASLNHSGKDADRTKYLFNFNQQLRHYKSSVDTE